VKQRWLRANPFAQVERSAARRTARRSHGCVSTSRESCARTVSSDRRSALRLTLAYLLLGSRASELVKRDVRDLDDNGRLLWINRTKTIGRYSAAVYSG
jgi:integrase